MEERIKAVLVDDEPAARASIAALLKCRPEIELLAECCNGEEAIDAIMIHKPDVVFLDIQMPGMDGFEVVKRVYDHHTPYFIFVTAYDQHALKAFELSALDYLLKPYDDERFYKSLDKASHAIASSRTVRRMAEIQKLLGNISLPAKQNSYSTRLAIKSNGKITFVPVDSTYYLESEGSFIRIFTETEARLASYTFKQLEEMLDPQRFIRIHKSYIINTDKIEAVERYFHGDYLVYLNNQAKLKLSRNYKEALGRIIR